jgi:hypothetical protein
MTPHIVVDSNKCFEWGDVTGECDAESPGSGGASPSCAGTFPCPEGTLEFSPGFQRFLLCL